jgi:hypothetical protein
MKGCSAYELEVGDEFSNDEGRNWLVVRTAPRYEDEEDLQNRTMLCMASQKCDLRTSLWVEVRLEERSHVILR